MRTPPLWWVIRDEMGLVGTKFGCVAGLCGVRMVHARQRADSFVRHAAVSGNLCRCGIYGRITAAVKNAASEMRMGKAA